MRRFDVYLVTLDPTRGSEIRKTRPCLIVSPDDMNRHLSTVIVAPMTTTRRGYPTRVSIEFAGTGGEIALDQIRTIDRSRLVRHLGNIDEAIAHKVANCLAEMFAYE
ncbi:MAG: type II toxin-antitoxin system PemK/MazF family toxin [Methyloceanibacter sp.]|nr:type II toxin-antitoxin system PemK/MazF family toxin [Methyloceanibacter sp.]